MRIGDKRTESLAASVARLAGDSDLVRTMTSIRSDGGASIALSHASLRALYKPEIEVLESLGNSARDWSLLRVAEGFNARRVRDCEFHGRVVLGLFNKYVPFADGLEVVAGLSRSTIADCVIGHNALIRDVRLLANYVVAEEAIVVDCGRVTCRTDSAFGNGNRLPLALESGGREVDVFAEIDVELAATVARPGSRRSELEDYRHAVADYRTSVTADRGFIGPGARVWGVQRVEDSFVGPAAVIDGATQVVRSTLLSTRDQPVAVESGSMVSDSLMQWGTRVTGLAVVEASVLIEHAQVNRHGKVKNSLVGPCSEVAAGEVASSLLGPQVNCPHQSLLISTYWPGGRGNVAYGANVGSNHTSRAPDQEFRAGEGLFIGLGANVRFPCDFSEAPYTVIACAVDLPPQKVTFPFSLISPPTSGVEELAAGLPPEMNRIRPGWMLYENIYAIRRNEAKFRDRNRDTRALIEFDVFRESIMAGVWRAIEALNISSQVQPFYTERNIPGLGKCVLTDADRVRALESYLFHARAFSLQALKLRARGALRRGEPIADLLRVADPSDSNWEFHRRALVEDFGVASVELGLALLAESVLEIAKICERTRGKDDTRGVRIINDYADVHPCTDRDLIVKAAWDEAARICHQIDGLLNGQDRADAPDGSPYPLRDDTPPSVLRFATSIVTA